MAAVYLFGPYAKGEATEKSDVDILIDKNGSPLKGLFALGGLYNDLCEAVGKEIDLITTSALEQESTMERTPWLIKNLNREKVILFENK